MAYIDQRRWAAAVQHPDWYLTVRPEYEALLTEARNSPRARARAIADEVYSFFEDHLADGTIALGTSGPNWDADRWTIDSAVIHHTNLPSGISRSRINAIHLTRIYARYYADPKPDDAAIRGTPIYSGHFRGHKQTFVGYHWLVRPDGALERLLADAETGWQAGNWDVNCRSIGICLDGQFDQNSPEQQMIAAVVRLLAGRYPDVSPSRIFGHREINPRTTCPGSTFLDGWKAALVDAL